MKRIGIVVIAVCFISGLLAVSAGAQMGGGKGKGNAMNKGDMAGGSDAAWVWAAAWECGTAPTPNMS